VPLRELLRAPRELQASESHRAAAALLELRPDYASSGALVERIDAQRAAGYRVVGSFEPGDAAAAAVGGFWIGENLAWGRFLYVDDLVTRTTLRGRGHADAVMRWVEEEARRESCDQLHLDSGVGFDRADAHRFYFRRGLVIASYHFATKVS
jgi:GNAT superfamily N-acetyltransferase